VIALRFARQMLLAEIGEAGQRRLEGATAPIAGVGLAHEVGEAYARRAGMGRIVAGPIDAALAPSFLENEAARAVVSGSRAALAAIRRTVLGEPRQGPQ
jgi:hypothetical protein